MEARKHNLSGKLNLTVANPPTEKTEPLETEGNFRIFTVSLKQSSYYETSP